MATQITPDFPEAPETVHKTIIFDHVSIAFEDHVVLDDVSFELTRGETKMILGVLGSGKSTILKLAIGLVQPDRGDITCSAITSTR
jgi:ABC-type transporter Mla maintaining outer membrane lipid asymmetry ATPase subunit MlaF